MASKKIALPLLQHHIPVRGRSQNDARMLERFVEQEGPVVVPFLATILDKGSLVMRRAAIEHMGRLDPQRAERYVRDARQALPAKATLSSQQERDELRSWYPLIGSLSALETFLGEGGRVEDLHIPHKQKARLYEQVAAQVAGLEPAIIWQRLRQVNLVRVNAVSDHGLNRCDEARTLAFAMLDHRDGEVQTWGQALLGFVDGLAALDEVRRRVRETDVEVATRVCEWESPEVQFKELSRFVGTASGRAKVLPVLKQRIVPDWFPLLEPHLDEWMVLSVLAFGRHPGALARMRAGADSAEFDRETQYLCHELGHAGDRDAAPILLRWLADPVGRSASPMLLDGLGMCAGLDAIPVIERLRENEPSRVHFYDRAIADIRQRGG